jgi:YbbR domain-containing protein
MTKLKTLSKLLFRNLHWKILSFASAVILWMVCINVADPVSNQQFVTTLKILNEEQITQGGAVLVDAGALRTRSVSVNVRATRRLLGELNRNRGKISPYIDLRPINVSAFADKPLTLRVACDLTGIEPDTYEILNIDPAEVELHIESYVEKTVPILLGSQAGEVREGYVALRPVITPGSVLIGGAASLMRSVASARLDVSVEDAAQDITSQENLYVVSTGGEVIAAGLDLGLRQAQVQVPVHKYGTVAIASPKISGNVAEGYSIIGVTVTPKEVLVVGPAQNLEDPPTIELPTISVNNWSQTRSETFPLSEFLADTGLSIRADTPTEAAVTITVAREAVRTFSVPIEQLHILGMSTEVTYNSREVSLTLKGLEKNINEVSPEELGGVIDITGLGPGRYDVAVDFTLPNGVLAVGAPPMVSLTVSEGTESPRPEGGGEAPPAETEEPAEDAPEEGAPEETGMPEETTTPEGLEANGQ